MGYIAALIVGLSLGLFGGGGSILAVPILVYLFEMQPIDATSYSLFIVGLIAAVGSVAYFRMGHVQLRLALIFSAAAVLAIYLTRQLLMPALPDALLSIGSFTLTKQVAVLVFFAFLMLAAAYKMITDRSPGQATPKPTSAGVLVIFGLAIGFVTGVTGAGGGFLIVPALVILLGLGIKQAVGTSLVIIAINSLLGFGLDVAISGFRPNWLMLLGFVLIAAGGLWLGTRMARRLPAKELKPAFGYFVLLMGGFILTKELFF